MSVRIELYRRNSPRKRAADRRPMTPARVWQIFFGLTLIWSAFAAICWLFGFDFTAESGYRKLNLCGFMRFVLPGELGQSISCVWWNLSAFYIMPAIALGIALKKTFMGSRTR